MTHRPRLSFLQLWFLALAAVFAAVLAVRLGSGGVETRSERPESLPEIAGTPRQSTSPAAPVSEAVVETMEIVPEASEPSYPATISPSATPSPTGSDRDRAYRELLRAPAPGANTTSPPGAARAPAPPNTTTQPRRTTPPRNETPRRTPAPDPRPTPTPANNEPPQTRDPGDTDDDDNGGEEVTPPLPDDPESDRAAPRFEGAMFDPPVINDGGETTVFVMASDDLSGVRSVTGSIIGPAGAPQGFGATREGETNRFISRIKVPKDAADGMWHLNFLTVIDNAGNSATFSHKQGSIPQSASFRVQSADADTTGPVLKSVVPEALGMKAGDKLGVMMEVEDDKSGVGVVTGVYLAPSKHARIGFACQSMGEGTPAWRCEIRSNANSECGDWTLDQIQLQDKAHNTTIVRSNDPLLARAAIVITGDQCDSHPPVLQNITLDNPVITSPGAVTLQLYVTDDASGVASISGAFMFSGPVEPGTQPPRVFFSTNRGEGDRFVATATIPDKSPKGLYKLVTVQLLDKAQNLKLHDANDPIVSRVSFEVQ
jgi:hypothetical protein